MDFAAVKRFSAVLQFIRFRISPNWEFFQYSGSPLGGNCIEMGVG
jgi:hypothetical protein